MKLEAVLDRLQGVRRNGSGWQARCPAHKDRSPSLSIREGKGGRVLLHCFAGCTIEAICAAMGIKVSDLFPAPGTVQLKPHFVRETEKRIADLRSRLTPSDRERGVTVIKTDKATLNFALARALALAVECELVQVVLDGEAQ